MTKNAILLVAITLCLTMYATPQAPTKVQPKSSRPASAAKGRISGRVFAITQAGDLKPARFSHIYLVAPVMFANFEIEVIANKFSAGDGADCRQKTLNWQKGLVEMLRYGSTNNLPLFTADADEEGAFEIEQIPPGTYHIVVRGRAGANEAYWDQELTLAGGQNLTMKLSKPGDSCVLLGD